MPEQMPRCETCKHWTPLNRPPGSVWEGYGECERVGHTLEGAPLSVVIHDTLDARPASPHREHAATWRARAGGT